MPAGVSCFLRIGDDALESAVRYTTKEAAVEAFKDIHDELAAPGQQLHAALHICKRKTNMRPTPDYVLKRGIRGGVVMIPQLETQNENRHRP